MKKKIRLILVLCFVLVFLNVGYTQSIKRLSQGQKERLLKTLPDKYRAWYELIYYISADEERDVFFSLTNNKDRDLFIQAFWQQRDPTSGTDDNEYKTEIERRFEYVQKYFSRASSKPGWLTDMGKFYMILGKPNSIETFDNKRGLYPAQVWYYYGEKSLGLPTYFNVTFFKPNNTTEWKFYSPYTDGPAALMLRSTEIDSTNFEGMYEKMKELAPALALPSITMIPNEIGTDFRPSPRMVSVISNIYDSPKRKINASYATHFLNYKGYVNVESSVNFVENSKMVSVTKYDVFDFSFVNISLKPKRLSVKYSEEKKQYYFNYEINVNLRDGDKFIYEYKKNFDFYIDPDRVDALKGNGIVIHDSFPVIPGKYKLTVFAMNSVGKEFTYFETDISSPPSNQIPALLTPVVGYKLEEQTESFFFPYNFNNKKLYVDTDKTLKLKEKPVIAIGICNLDTPLWETGKIEFVLKGVGERSVYKKSYETPLKQFSYRRNINVVQQLGEEGLGPDYYELEARLIDSTGKILDSKLTDFTVSPSINATYPTETFKKIRAENPFYFQYILASQYEKMGLLTEAETYYAKCIENNPGFKEGYVFYLTVLNKLKKYTQVLVEVDKLKGDAKFEFDYNLVKATAHYGMKDYNDALDNLLRANAIYNSDTRVLNLLGYTLLNLAEYVEAEKVFKASLALDEKQEEIQKAMQEAKKRIKPTSSKVKK
jgi:GWxTD domain-containing protein